MIYNRYKINAHEANKIPILEIARRIVPKFIDRGSNSTGKCVKHIDNKLGNLRFKTDKNYAHCFTCNTTWGPVNFVMDFLNLEFFEALKYLHKTFPHYFTTNEIDVKQKKRRWKGLLIKEYKVLNINNFLYLGNTPINIRDFAESFPKEYNSLLHLKAYAKKEEINTLYEKLKGKVDGKKLENDKKEYLEEIERLLNKGVKKEQVG